MDKPETVKIGTRTYTIKHQGRLAGDCLGLCFAPSGKAKGLILIKTGQTPRNEFDTIIHEVLHGICDQKNLKLEHDEEERIVTALANGLTRFFKDNPDYTESLMSLLDTPQ